MDSTSIYRDIVKKIICKYAELRPSHGDIRLDVIFDETHDRYALMQVGWDRGRRIRGNLIYVTLNNDKVYIEYDGVGHGIADELIDAGIAESDLILAYLQSYLLNRRYRQHF
jgi:hypothetical protein